MNFDKVKDQFHQAQDYVNKMTPKEKAVGAAAVAGSLLTAIALKKVLSRPPKAKTYDDAEVLKADNYYDVAIVGAGPSGSTCAFYLSKAGKKVLLLDKKQFPRDKYCGDAVSYLAQHYLREMGAFQELVAEKKLRMARVGGIVSPKGYSFIGNSAQELNLGEIGVMAAVKRIDLDEKIVRAAQRAGAHLTENSQVTETIFDEKTGTWEVRCINENQPEQVPRVYRARMLVCADGSPSSLARKLGIVKNEPDSFCSRQYIKAGTHNFGNMDGVCFYPRALLPGYAAIFAEADGDVNYLCYIIPGGQMGEKDLASVHEDLAKNDPNISKLLGPNYEPRERMKGASLRLGGIEKSVAENCIVIGDACGMIDPLTGEGIHLAMHSGKLGADSLLQAFESKNFTEGYLNHVYHKKWTHEFASEFYWSMKMSQALNKFPIVLDAAALLINRKGGNFLADWALVMSGQKSKLWFARPDVGLSFLYELVREFIFGGGAKKNL
jgi:geranylgeranyl reductase family protein